MNLRTGGQCQAVLLPCSVVSRAAALPDVVIKATGVGLHDNECRAISFS
jgi:hypothetical protein